MKGFVAFCAVSLSSCLLVASMHLPEDYQGSESGKVQAAKTALHQDQVTNATIHCFVDAGIIMTFPSTVSDQLRQDILYSLLLAQKGADKKALTSGYQFNRNIELVHWVDYFNEILTDVAWTFQSKDKEPTDVQVKESKFNLTGLILQIMSGNGMASDVSTFKKVLSTYNALPNTDYAVKAFTNRTYDETTRDTTVMVASIHQSSPTSDALMSLLLVNLQGVKDSTTRPLSHTYSTKDVKTKKMLPSQQVFGQEMYSKIRQQVADKLKPYIKSNIKEVTLKK